MVPPEPVHDADVLWMKKLDETFPGVRAVRLTEGITEITASTWAEEHGHVHPVRARPRGAPHISPSQPGLERD